MEDVDWWKSAYETSAINELKYMTPEILLLRGLWKENKRLWRISFPFHLGLYLMVANFFLLLLSAVFTLWVPATYAEGRTLRLLMDALIAVSGSSGIVAGLIGALGLLYIRVADRDMKHYSTTADYFNIVFILTFFLCAFLTAAFVDPFFMAAKSYLLGLLTAGTYASTYQPGQNVFGALTILLASLLAAYIPLTHMSHMYMKYFLYHKVKWDDAPNSPGSNIESAVLKNLKLKPTWKAKHIGADGEKSWQDIASSAPKDMK